jgi:DNA mismatch endonuclease, patch repair protein
MTEAASWASAPAIRARMQAQRTADTSPEVALRRELHRLGLRYRLHRRPIPEARGTADIVFTPALVAVYIDGCYWHGCPEHFRPGSKNLDFWLPKIEANRARDERSSQLLADMGWLALRVWEHEEPVVAAMRIRAVLRERRSPSRVSRSG